MQGETPSKQSSCVTSTSVQEEPRFCVCGSLGILHPWHLSICAGSRMDPNDSTCRHASSSVACGRLLSQLYYPEQETGRVPAAPNGAADGCVCSWSMHRCYSPACNTTLPQHALCPQTQGSAQIAEVTYLAATSAAPKQSLSIYSFIFTARWQDRKHCHLHLSQNVNGGSAISMTWTATAGRNDKIFWLTVF